ncbi:MAG TPA: trypsin-like peptidase domain-containing protein [Lacipirellula sp.]
MRASNFSDWMSRCLAAVVIAFTLAASLPALADDPSEAGQREGIPSEDEFGLERLFVPRWRLTDGPHVRAAFREVIKDAAEATVCIHCDGKHTAVGGIIRSDGWIVTKATPLCGNLTVVLADGRKFEAATVAESGEYDLALLKVDAKNLPTLDLSGTEVPEVGSWLATVGRSRDPLAVGVVSVPPRKIPPQAGILGVQLDGELPLVVKVFPDSAAEEAGVEAHDRILQVNGRRTPSRERLKEIVGSYNPGDDVELIVDRDGQSLTLKATLGGMFPGLMGRNDFQNTLGGKLSVRRFGFPTAFQHDSVLRPTDCGGPVVDVDGRVVGFNIARAGRTESYALPNAAVQEVVEKLMTEKLMVETQPAQ